MAATTTKIGIINNALQMLGEQSINSLSDNSIGAKEMSRAYEDTRLSELRSNTWNFAIKRANLPADATPPIFGKARYFSLPGDFLFLAPDETTLYQTQRHDFNIEGNKIVTSEQGPLPIRYVSSSVTESDFDVMFVQVFSASLAIMCCESITNSNAKKQTLMAMYQQALRDARNRNSIENAPRKQSVPTWISVRQ